MSLEKINRIEHSHTSISVSGTDTSGIQQVLDEIKDFATKQAGPEKAADVIQAADHLGDLLAHTSGSVLPMLITSPFDFDDSIVFSYKNGIFALANAINGLLAMQPQIISSEMAISTELVSPQITKWSDYWLEQLQTIEAAIKTLGPKPDPGTLADYQAQMSVASAQSSASSTSLNGVLSMLTSGTSSKTTTYQNLTQQVQSVVTALLNAMIQNWG